MLLGRSWGGTLFPKTPWFVWLPPNPWIRRNSWKDQAGAGIDQNLTSKKCELKEQQKHF